MADVQASGRLAFLSLEEGSKPQEGKSGLGHRLPCQNMGGRKCVGGVYGNSGFPGPVLVAYIGLVFGDTWGKSSQ